MTRKAQTVQRANYSSGLKIANETINISKKEYRLIIGTMFFLLMKDAINTGARYSFPEGLGTMGVYKKPTYGRGIFNYKLYNETGEKSYIKNDHSYRHTAVFRWFILGSSFSEDYFKSLCYTWSASRYWKRYLAQKIKGEANIHIYNDLQ